MDRIHKHFTGAADVRVCYDLVNAVDRCCRDADGEQFVDDFLDGFRLGPFFHNLFDHNVIFNPVAGAGEVWVIDQFRAPDVSGEQRPEFIVAAANNHQIILRLERIIGVHGFITVANALGQSSFYQIDHVDNLKAGDG